MQRYQSNIQMNEVSALKVSGERIRNEVSSPMSNSTKIAGRRSNRRMWFEVSEKGFLNGYAETVKPIEHVVLLKK